MSQPHYSNTLLGVWAQAGNIIEGIRNSVFKSADVEAVAAERMKICEACPSIDRTGENCVLPGTQPCCGECGCKLAWATRSMSYSCRLEKWGAVLTAAEAAELEKSLKA